MQKRKKRFQTHVNGEPTRNLRLAYAMIEDGFFGDGEFIDTISARARYDHLRKYWNQTAVGSVLSRMARAEWCERVKMRTKDGRSLYHYRILHEVADRITSDSRSNSTPVSVVAPDAPRKKMKDGTMAKEVILAMVESGWCDEGFFVCGAEFAQKYKDLLESFKPSRMSDGYHALQQAYRGGYVERRKMHSVYAGQSVYHYRVSKDHPEMEQEKEEMQEHVPATPPPRNTQKVNGFHQDCFDLVYPRPSEQEEERQPRQPEESNKVQDKKQRIEELERELEIARLELQIERLRAGEKL